MTGFEKFLKDKGAKLISGSEAEFTTYGNIQRTWLFSELCFPIQVGLMRYKDNNTIMLRYPAISYLPVDNYGEFLREVLKSRKIQDKIIIDELFFIIDNNE